MSDSEDEKLTDEIPVYSPKSPVPKGIADATSFDELYSILRALGTISGRPHTDTGVVTTYTAEEVIQTIDSMRAGNTGVTVTRAEGLRRKVNELLAAEQNQ